MIIRADELREQHQMSHDIKADGRKALEQLLLSLQVTGHTDVKLPLNYWGRMKIGYYLENGGFHELNVAGYKVEMLKTSVKISWEA